MNAVGYSPGREFKLYFPQNQSLAGKSLHRPFATINTGESRSNGPLSRQAV